MSVVNPKFLESFLCDLNRTLQSLQKSTKPFFHLEFLQLLHNAQQIIGNLEHYTRTGLATLVHRIPSVLLLSIFQFLYSTEYKPTQLVCKVWYQVWKLPIARPLWRMKSSGRLVQSWAGTDGASGIVALENRVFVRGSDRIFIFDPNGKFLHDIEIISHYPQPLAIDKTGLLYLAFYDSDRIEVYNQNGIVERIWSCEKPYALAVTDNKVLVISSSRNCKICQFTLQGILIQEWSNIYNPYSIAVDQNEIFIADPSKIEVFSEDGRKLREWRTKVKFGIAVSGELVYVLDGADRCTRVFSRNGNYLFQFNLPDSCTWPGGIFVLHDIAYISDTRNKVYMFAIE